MSDEKETPKQTEPAAEELPSNELDKAAGGAPVQTGGLLPVMKAVNDTAETITANMKD